MRVGSTLGFAIALGFLHAIAHAEPTEVASLTYHAPASCPDERAFVAAVSARTARATFAENGARQFSVLLEKRADGFHGRLSVGGGMRDLASPRCKDLFDAFVLFVAIAIDPDGPSTPPSPSEPPPAEVEPDPPPPPQRPPVAAAPPPSRPAWHLSFGSGLLLASGVADRALVSAHPFVDLASDAIGVSPSARLGILWANGGAQHAPGSSTGQLTLGLRALALSGCAIRSTLGRVSLRACGQLEGGWLTVRPFGIAYPTSPDRPWFAAGPLGRAEVPLASRLALGAEMGALFPFERERVYVRGNPASALVSAVGIRFAAFLTVTGF